MVSSSWKKRYRRKLKSIRFVVQFYFRMCILNLRYFTHLLSREDLQDRGLEAWEMFQSAFPDRETVTSTMQAVKVHVEKLVFVEDQHDELSPAEETAADATARKLQAIQHRSQVNADSVTRQLEAIKTGTLPASTGTTRQLEAIKSRNLAHHATATAHLAAIKMVKQTGTGTAEKAQKVMLPDTGETYNTGRTQFQHLAVRKQLQHTAAMVAIKTPKGAQTASGELRESAVETSDEPVVKESEQVRESD